MARGVQEGDYLDLEERDVLVLRVRGDGRKYLVSLRTDNWVVGAKSHDVWQAFLFAPCARPSRAARVGPWQGSAPRLRRVLHGRVHVGVQTGHAYWRAQCMRASGPSRYHEIRETSRPAQAWSLAYGHACERCAGSGITSRAGERGAGFSGAISHAGERCAGPVSHACERRAGPGAGRRWRCRWSASC